MLNRTLLIFCESIFLAGSLAGAALAGPVPPLDSKGPAADGQRYDAASEGAEFFVPRNWKYAEQEDSILLGSDTEPGAIFVWASDAKSASDIQGEMQKALVNTGGRFGALEGVQQAALSGGKATVAEASGVDEQGTKMRARLVAVVGPERTVFVGGLTTDEAPKFSNLRKRVDSVARSVKFAKPAASGGKSPVAGQWWSYSAAAGYSGSGSERTMAFCPDGRFVEKGESYYSGSAGSVAGSGGGAGRWKAQGGARQGTVTVTYADGSTAEYNYVAKGPDDLKFNNRAYGRTQVTLCR